MRFLDLFSGSGSASRAAAVRGWNVVRVDNGEGTAADIRADLATWEPTSWFDVVWASPPCTQLSTASRLRDVDAGLVLVDAALRIIRAINPRWWVLENVHGATRAIASRIGPPVACYGSFYLWGCFPPFEAQVSRDKTKLSGRRRAERRAAIPWAIADGLVRACEALAAELPPAIVQLAPPGASRPGPHVPPSSPPAGSGPGPLEPPPAPELAPRAPRCTVANDAQGRNQGARVSPKVPARGPKHAGDGESGPPGVDGEAVRSRGARPAGRGEKSARKAPHGS